MREFAFLKKVPQLTYALLHSFLLISILVSHQASDASESVSQSIPESSPSIAEVNSGPSPGQDSSNQAPHLKTTAYQSAFDYFAYPRVTVLEKQLFGAVYAHNSLTDRLDRLEKKAFGKASSSNDLHSRVELLEEYARRHDLFHEGYGDNRTVHGFISRKGQWNESANRQTETPARHHSWLHKLAKILTSDGGPPDDNMSYEDYGLFPGGYGPIPWAPSAIP